jgi:hypothetical protein
MVLVDLSFNILIRVTFRSLSVAIFRTWTGLGGKLKRLGRKRQENGKDYSKVPAQTDS